MDRDEEIETCQVKAQGAHQIADKHRQALAVSLACKEAEMAKMRMQLVETDQRQASLSGECVMNVG